MKHAVILHPRFTTETTPLKRIQFEYETDARLVASVLEDLQGFQYTKVEIFINPSVERQTSKELPHWKSWLMNKIFGRFLWF